MAKKNSIAGVIAAACLVGITVGSSAKAALVDTYTRADGPVTADSIGTTESGGYIYAERGDSPLTTTQNPTLGTAELTGTQLRVTGYAPNSSRTTGSTAITSNPGGVYLTNFSSANVTIKADIAFQNFDSSTTTNPSGAFNTDPGSTGTSYITTYAEYFARTQVAQTLGNSASDNGLLDIAIGPQGDQQVREIQNGTLVSLGNPTSGFANPFKATNSVTRTKVTGTASLARIANYSGSHVIDANGNGFVDGTESFNYTAVVSGNTVTTFIDGVQVAQWTNLMYTSGANGNLIGLSKNRRASADTYVSDVYYDNLDVTPEPGTLAVLAAGIGGATLTRRRRA